MKLYLKIVAGIFLTLFGILLFLLLVFCVPLIKEIGGINYAIYLIETIIFGPLVGSVLLAIARILELSENNNDILVKRKGTLSATSTNTVRPSVRPMVAYTQLNVGDLVATKVDKISSPSYTLIEKGTNGIIQAKLFQGSSVKYAVKLTVGENAFIEKYDSTEIQPVTK